MVEEAPYKVIKNLGPIEVRSYPSIIMARVDGYGDGGFNLLFRYISGENVKRSKVHMTAPVVSEQIAMTAPVLSEASSIAFVMPEGYTLETTPEPLDGRVHIVEVPPRFVAALRFSGRWSERNESQRSQKLLRAVKDAGLATKRKVFTMRYNSPFTPWFMRRNEVAIELELEGEGEIPGTDS